MRSRAIGKLVFWRVAIKPGRPVAMGVLRGTAFVGLPGNPVAVFVTFARVVRPLLLRLAGAAPEPLIALPVACGLCVSQEKGAARICARVADAAGGRHVRGAQASAGRRRRDLLADRDGRPRRAADDVTEIAPGEMIGFLPYSVLAGSTRRFRERRQPRRVFATSSGVFTLKNGSTGSAGQSASATPWRAVHTSILRRSSTVMAWRRSSRSATGQSPTTGWRQSPECAQASGLFSATRAAMQARHEIARQERAIARHADDPFGARPVRRGPVEARRECRRAARRNPARCRRPPASRTPRSAPDRRWR